MKRNAPALTTAAAALLTVVGITIVGRGADLSSVLGVAHVDGKYFLAPDEDYLNEGADQVLATGSKTIKVYLTPVRYPWNSQWPKGAHTLVERAQWPYYKALFAKPITTYILTAYSVGREEHYWSSGIDDAQKADETRQFHDLAAYLLTTYKGTGKTFVLQHWEGDWALRHGSPKPYDIDYTPTPTAVDGMIQWLNARQAGIKQARDEVRDTDVHVYGAAEANRVEDSMAGKPGVANAVLPHTTVDLVSYSSYNFLQTPERLSKAVDYLAAHLPPTAVFGQNPHSVYLGEYGYPENGQEGAAGVNSRLNSAFDVVREKGLPWAIFWEVYCNELKKDAPPAPVNGNDAAVMGYWMVKPDGTPGTAWHRYRQMIEASVPDHAALEAKAAPIFEDRFDRPDGAALGTAWSTASHYGVVRTRLRGGHLTFEIPDGAHTPWGSATLDLTNPKILGRGLRVGESFEVTVHRLGDHGIVGVELFDSDQLRQGSGIAAGPSALHAWNGTTWVPISIDGRGDPARIDWTSPHAIGVRMDTADGHFASFSYYVDGAYAASWLVKTANRTLDKVGVFAQSDAADSSFECGPLRVYGSK